MSEESTLYQRFNTYKTKKRSGEDVTGFEIIDETATDQLVNYKSGPETITDFENSATVLRNYETVTDYLSQNSGVMSSLLDAPSTSFGEDGVAEMMRDSTARVSTIVNQAMKMQDAPENVKKAYRDLRSDWEKVDMNGGKEWWNFVKDYGTDVVASYETLPALAALFFSGGTAAAGGAATHSAARLALHKALTSSANAVAGNTVKSTAAYAGTIGGIHDLASQDLAVDLGERDDISYGQAAAVAGFSSVIGGGIGYGLKKAFSKTNTNKLKSDLEEQGGNEVVTVNVVTKQFIEDAVRDDILDPSVTPIVNQLDLFDVDDVIEVPDSVVRKITTQTETFVRNSGGGDNAVEELDNIVVGALNSGATGKKIKSKILYNMWKMGTGLTGKYFGKAAGILTPYTKFSNTAATLQRRLSHEFAEGFTKQKENIGMDFDEVQKAITGRYTVKYLNIIEPLALNSVKGNLADDVNAELNKAIRGVKSKHPKIQRAATEIQLLFKEIGQELQDNGIIEKQVENYIPRMWNRKAIENNADEFMELLVKSNEAANLSEAKDIVYGKVMKVKTPDGFEEVRMGGMLDIQNQLDGGSGGQYFASKRKFEFTDDSIFTDFLNTDLLDVAHQYNFQAGKALAKRKVLLSGTQKQFEKRWIEPIAKEMKAAGKTLSDKEKGEILSLYQHATGEGLQRFGTAAQTISDGYTLGTRLALLPLATIGSLTEILINVSKAGVINSIKGFGEASEVSFSKISGNLHKDLMTRHGLTANEAWRELKQFGIAMEQSQAQLGQRLVGDDLATESMQNASNKFFRLNFLDQWTKFVQMTSFASGKNMIKENLEFLAAQGDTALTKKAETIMGELKELNIDINQGIKWVQGGAKTTDRYYNNILSGAARYTNSVILQPSAASGLKPLAHTNPRTTVLFQLLGYPAAFTNTVLKGAVKAVVKAPTRNAPKVFTAGFLMTESARWLNWARTHGESEEYSSPTEARLSAIKRWGGNGLLFDNLQRASDSAKYSGTVSGFLTAPFGPIANDILGLAHGKYFQTAGTKVPFYTAGNVTLGLDTMREYRRFLKDKDKELKSFIPEFEKDIAKERFNKGGEVNVPNAPKEPDERINKYTGRPYNEDAGSAFMDTLDPKKVERQGFALGSIAKIGGTKLRGFVAEAINDYSNGLTKPEVINEAAQQIETVTGINPNRFDEATYDPMEADIDVGQMMGEVDEDVENYVMSFLKVHLNEKDISKAVDPEKAEKVLKEKGADSEEYYKAMGYDEDYLDEVEYLKNIIDEVDPDREIAFDIENAVATVRQNKNYYSFDSTDQAAVDQADELGLEELSEFLAYRLGADDTISEEGKVSLVKNVIGKNLKDSQFAENIKSLRDSMPSKTPLEDDAYSKLPDEELMKNLDDYLNASVETKPMFRGISAFGDREFEISFFSPREMGTHVGARGQAEYIMAKKLNENRVLNDFSVPSRGGEPVSEIELDSFYSDELTDVTSVKGADFNNMSVDEFSSLGGTKSDVNLTMMKGYIQVKNPLVVDDDMGNWSASNLLTLESDTFIAAVANGLGKKIPKKALNKLEALQERALEHTGINLEDLSPNAEALVFGTIENVKLTKDLQKWLNDLGFDSIKYKNKVESLMESDVDANYEDYSYILFEPKQYKSVNAREFNVEDSRMMRNEGGLIYDVQKGDNLTKIAARNNTDVQTLVNLNKLNDADTIAVGQQLKIPENAAPVIGEMLWATRYNAEPKPLKELLEKYRAAQSIKATDRVKDVAKYAANSGAFSNELMDMGLTPDELEQGLIDYSKIESSGGNLPKSKQVSSGKAQGLFQVIYPSAKSVLEQGQFGAKSAEAAGYTLDELNNMSKEELRGKLLNDDKLNALFASAIIVQKLQTLKNEETPRVKKNLGSIVSKAIAPKMAEGFYSALEKAALNLKRKEGTGQGFLNDLKKGEKVTADELEFTGVADQLKDIKKISKEEVQDIVSSSKINLKTIRGDSYGEKQFETAYDEYTLAQSTNQADPVNYEEILITLPSNTGNSKIDNASHDQFNHWYHAKEQAVDEDIDKIIAHLRVTDAKGGEDFDKPTLLIEEIQSDYHQAGSKQGYNKNTTKPKEDNALLVEFKDKIKFDHEAKLEYNENDPFVESLRRQNLIEHENILESFIKAKVPREDIKKFNSIYIKELNKLLEINERLDSLLFDPNISEAAAEKLEDQLLKEASELKVSYGKQKDEISDEVKQALKNHDSEAYQETFDESMDGIPPELRESKEPVPDAPFKKSWYKLALNKALIDAAEKDKQAIALTTGKQQAARYVNEDTGEGQEGLAKKYDGVYLKYLKAFAKKYNKEVETEYILTGNRFDSADKDPIHTTYYLELTPEMKDDILKGLPQFAEGGLVEAEEEIDPVDYIPPMSREQAYKEQNKDFIALKKYRKKYEQKLKDDYEKQLEAEGTPINKETHEISINYYNQPFVERKRKKNK